MGFGETIINSQHMKNIIIRVENTLFDTARISRHLPVAKHRDEYLHSSLPKCSVNGGFTALLGLVAALRAKGRPVSLTLVTGFRGEALWRLLSANGLAWVRIAPSVARAADGGDPARTVLLSASPEDAAEAESLGIQAVTDTRDADAVLAAAGVRRAPSRPGAA